ncbi:MAG TPA: L-histidine N(alpha)-methyltransferase [Afifellaceae bacterium]|nr:L-histidine N(alpha)-methyltransferase [Afifellaceae bacterium]
MPVAEKRPRPANAEAATTTGTDETFARTVLEGLRQVPKALPPKLLYDARGSELFDRICELEEYYPTRTELGILRERAAEIGRLAGPGAVLVEFGSGSSLKVRIVLDELPRPAAYIPVDISGDHLEAAAEALRAEYPDLPIVPLAADFTKPLRLPAVAGDGRRLGFFPGSTIGNFEPPEAEAFLAQARRLLGPGAALLIGVDLKKDEAILNAAYDDADGVTAAFNLNLLARINREAGGDFEPDGFAHRAFYNAGRGRVEMHLASLRDQIVQIAGERIAFSAGETIHTESSYKYAPEELAALFARAGWRALRRWTDAGALFSVWFLEEARPDR